MTLVILAAGFATRLEPLTIDTPKHLLPLKGKKVLMDLFIETIAEILPGFNKIILVTNQGYYNKFLSWAKNSTVQKIKILSDGVNSKEERIGAIGDLLFAIDKGKINDDMLICAADYVLRNVDFKKYLKFSEGRSTTIVKEEGIEALKSGSCLRLGKNFQVTKFAEKPIKPFSNLYGVPYYYLHKSDIRHIGLIPKNLHDNIGQLVAKLVDDSKIFAYRYSGDIIHLTCEKDYLLLKPLEKTQN